MVVRVSHPGTPTKLIDLGYGEGHRHNFVAMRKTIDQYRPWFRVSHPIHNVELDRPR